MARRKKARARRPRGVDLSADEPRDGEERSPEPAAEPARPAEARSGGGKTLGGMLAGSAIVLAGVGTLLYPALQTREGFREVVAAVPYLPAYAVVLVAAGMAILLASVHVASGEPQPWALDATNGEGLRRKLRELNFLAVFRELDREAAAERRARGEDAGYDWKPILAFSLGAVFLALMEYYGHASSLREVIDALDPPGRIGPADNFAGMVRDSPFRRLLEFAWWSGWRVLGFFLLPALVVRAIFRERVVDYGLQTRGFREHAWIYAGAFVFVLILVIGVSYEDSFRTYYPFYREASRSWYDFWSWELLYAAQFFSLEFFFRGFWVNAGKRSMGSHAIYAMLVPYVMIHFGKPFPETIAAIFAGLALGTLALRTRSIWSGFLIHVSVAISMDMAALMQTTGLPERWWPDL